MKLLQALDKLCELEMGIHVDFDDDLPSFELIAAWPVFPPGGNNTLEVPCAWHSIGNFAKTDYLNALGLSVHSIGLHVMVASSWVDAHLQSRRALGVHEALRAMFVGNLMLGDGQSYINNLRSERGAMLDRMEWPPVEGVGYVGLDYTVDLYLYETQLAGVGD